LQTTLKTISNSICPCK